jgi:anti-sigma factor RsiW
VDGDELTELALGHVDGPARARMAAHLLMCTACRHDYDALVAAIEEVLPAVPGVQPPLGFDERVLDRIRPRRRRRRWWVAGVAAAALVVVAALGVGWATAGTGDEEVTAAVLARPDGGEVGSVSLSEVDGDRMMVVAIVDAPPGVSYTCVARLNDGTSVESHPWEPGAGAWIVPLPAEGDVTDVDLVVTGTDRVWSSATFT